MIKSKVFLLLGAGGQLAKEFQIVAARQGLKLSAPAEEASDITNTNQLEKTVHAAKPDAIINCAAYNLVDEAQAQPSLAFAVNGDAVDHLASLCKKNNIFLVHYSSDYVFDGQKDELYIEEDGPNPINVYGESKLKGEEAVQSQLDDYLLLRLSWVFGMGQQNFLFKLWQWAKKQDVLKISSDEVSVPTYTQDVVNATFLSLEKGLKGLYHLTNSGYCSRFELAKYFFEKMQLKNKLVPTPQSEFNLKAKRPAFSAMSNGKLVRRLKKEIPDWKDAVDRYVKRTVFK